MGLILRRRITNSVIAAMLLAVVSMFVVLSVNAAPGRFYAGYYYYRSEGHPPPYGVFADIRTIDQDVPTGQFYAQWPTVMLSYTYMYWIQVGYTKGYGGNLQLRWYAEKWDEYGWSPPKFYGSPNAWSYYGYWISKNPDTGRWTGGVDSIWTHDFGTLTPNNAVDYQAFSEMTENTIEIDGTHFRGLSLKYTRYDWILWDRHVKRADPPYGVTEISHYEFYASGGG